MIIRVLTARSDRRARDVRHGEPVTFSVPLPAGSTADPSNWTVRAADTGLRLPLQARVLDRWLDGSARWVLVDTQIASGPEHDGELFVDTTGAPVEAGQALRVTNSNGSISVDTGLAEFVLRQGTGFPIASAVCDGTGILDSLASALVLTDRTGAERPVQWRSAAVESQGPLRTVVRIDGDVDAGGRSLQFTMRLHFFAGQPVIRALVTVTNPQAAAHPGGFWDLGDPGSILIRDLTLRAALSGSAARFRCSAEVGAAAEEYPSPVSIYQDSSGGEAWQSTNHINRERRVPVVFRGYRVSSGGCDVQGSRANPIAIASGAVSGIGAVVPQFWQNFPMALEAGEQGIAVRLFPGQFADLHELQGGEQKTHECWLAFGPHVSAESLEWCRSRTVASVDSAHVVASGAVPFLAPLDDPHAALVAAAVEGPDRFELKREVIDQYGWRHFGEIYGDHESIRQKSPPIVSHYNNQYDPLAGFIYQYLRSADTRWWRMATELAGHVLDIDIYHTQKDASKYNGGMFWHTYHYGDADTATHRTYPKAGQGRIHGGGPSADHNYTTGLMHQYFLTGDEAFRDAVLGLARFVIDLDDGAKSMFRWIDRGDTGRATLSAGYYGPGRGPANSLNVLIDGHRLSGERAFLEKAEQIIRRVVHPDEDVRRHRLDDAEERWFYTMFLQSLGKYLHYKVERGELDAAYAYGRASLLSYARWMAAHEHPYLEKPEKLEFPTETWAAQDIRKSDVFHYAALHADGEERSAFAERGRFFHDYSTATLARMPTRALARPVIVLLTSGFMDPWMSAHTGAAEPAPPRPGPFAPQAPFVPQLERVKRKLTLAVAAGAAFTLLAAAWVFLR